MKIMIRDLWLMLLDVDEVTWGIIVTMVFVSGVMCLLVYGQGIKEIGAAMLGLVLIYGVLRLSILIKDWR